MIRPLREEDKALIFNSWLRSFESSERAGLWTSKASYRAHYEPIIGSLIHQTRIYCNPEDEDQIFGYICCDSENKILHYIYVKALFRDQKDTKPRIAMKLLEDAGFATVEPFSTSFWTPQWHRYATHHRLTYTYDRSIVNKDENHSTANV